MRVDVVTLFPAMFDALTQHGVTGRAIQRGMLQLGLWNVRDYAHDRHRTVDDRPYGGGPGMVMQVQPLRDAIHAATIADATPAPHRDVQVSPEAGCRKRPRVIYLSPQGRRLDQAGVRELAAVPRLILVAGRYEGVDERVLQANIDEEWSIGDYVLSGGELAAMVMIDAVARLLPGVLGHEDSAQQDSFGSSNGGVDGPGLLDYPHYTRPEEVDGARVPAVLLSGDHQAIARWRQKQALGRTWLRRPDLLVASGILPLATLAHPCAAEAGILNPAQKKLLDEFIREYYGSSVSDTDLPANS
jgi:tRNA (guanine37-N1)-methyltransferase